MQVWCAGGPLRSADLWLVPEPESCRKGGQEKEESCLSLSSGFSRLRFKFWKVTERSKKASSISLFAPDLSGVRPGREHRPEPTAGLLGGSGPPRTCIYTRACAYPDTHAAASCGAREKRQDVGLYRLRLCSHFPGHRHSALL